MRFLRITILICFGVSISAAGGAHAQSSAPGPTPPGSAAPAPTGEKKPQTPDEFLASLPPQIRLGVRVEALQRGIPVLPVLVIVPDADSFAQQIAEWSLTSRFPILIDDGSVSATENIARFVRAFQPVSVARFEPTGSPLPRAGEGRRDAIERALLGSWDVDSGEALVAEWQKMSFRPPGVVFTNERDPAWPAGLTLAAARGQPLLWLDIERRNPGAVMDAEKLGQLLLSVSAAIEAIRAPWRDIGDFIDAITLALNIETRIPGEGGDLALTDRVGRHEDGSRFAWCGMIFGDSQEALYQAMCAVFLQPKKAWLFDGYEQGFAPPFALGAMRDVLVQRGFEVSADLPPTGSLSTWRLRALAGVNADFVHINTKGHWNWFDLSPGRANGSDVPMLLRPAMVHVIHSFSAQRLAVPGSIAGRFLENGAYAYAGSVHEPFLGAFQRGEALAGRLLSKVPWGIAARIDGAPPWKINVFGDPLITWGDTGPRLEAAETPANCVLVEDEMREALKSSDLETAVRDLIMLGRDRDVVRIVRALSADDQQKLAPVVALNAIRAAFRERDEGLVLELFQKLTPEQQADRPTLDLVWQIGRRLMGTAEGPKAAAILRAHTRDETVVEDAEAIAADLEKAFGRQSVHAMYSDLIGACRNDRDRERLEAAMRRL